MATTPARAAEAIATAATEIDTKVVIPLAGAMAVADIAGTATALIMITITMVSKLTIHRTLLTHATGGTT